MTAGYRMTSAVWGWEAVHVTGGVSGGDISAARAGGGLGPRALESPAPTLPPGCLVRRSNPRPLRTWVVGAVCHTKWGRKWAGRQVGREWRGGGGRLAGVFGAANKAWATATARGGRF